MMSIYWSDVFDLVLDSHEDMDSGIVGLQTGLEDDNLSSDLK